MADPTDQITGVVLSRSTEGTVQALSATAIQIAISGVGGNFEVGETVVESTSNAEGTILKVTATALVIETTSGTFTGGETLTGSNSLATATGGVLTDPAPAQSVDTGGCEKIELTNKGPDTVYFRCDETEPTAGASGNADQITNGASRIIERGKVGSVKVICPTGDTATVLYRLYS